MAQASGAPIEILLVEDNPGDVRLTQEAVREAKIRNTLNVVNDGEQAIAYVRRQGEYADRPRPDLILLDRRHPNLAPVIDGVGIVVHSGRGSNVDTVIVDGRVLIERGRAVAFDGDGIVAEAQAGAERLWARHGTRAVTRQ